MTREEIAFKQASEYLMKGFNCAQSVLISMQEFLNIQDKLVLKAATGFGGGIGNTGNICGALSAGVFTIGLIYGRDKLEQIEEKERTYIFCSEWLRIFADFFGSINCYDILKVDISNSDVRKAYWGVNKNRERCAKEVVGEAARLLIRYLDKLEKEGRAR